MASHHGHFMDTYIPTYESDDSEEDNSHGIAPMTRMDYEAMPVEALIEEISECSTITNNEELHNLHLSKANKKTCKSVALQTRPDASGIPSSWILTGERMVNELHTGITNVINVLYHHPFGNFIPATIQEHGAKTIISAPTHSGFTCSVPRLSTMIPAMFSRTDYQKTIVNSVDFKNKLISLRDTAEKLGKLIPYLDSSMNLEAERSGKIFKTMESKYQQTDFEMPESEHIGLDNRRYTEAGPSEVGLLSNFSSISTDTGASSNNDENTLNEFKLKEGNFPKNDFHKGILGTSVGRRIGSCEYINSPSLTASKNTLQKNKTELIIRNSPIVEQEDGKNIKEAHCSHKDSTARNKNFIKKNIEALKSVPHAMGSNRGSNIASGSSSSAVSQVNLHSQKKCERKK